MVWFKSCPRCEKGDLMLEDAGDSWCVRCIQCGYSKDVKHPAQAAMAVQVEARSTALAVEMAL